MLLNHSRFLFKVQSQDKTVDELETKIVFFVFITMTREMESIKSLSL